MPFETNKDVHFVTFTVVKWIDLFIRDEFKELIISSLKYCQQHQGSIILDMEQWCGF